jgi:hypothetical protein
MNAHALAQYQIRQQDIYDNMKKKFPIGSRIEQTARPEFGSIIIDGYRSRPARLIGHYEADGGLVRQIILHPSAVGIGGRRRTSRRVNRSRKSRRR